MSYGSYKLTKKDMEQIQKFGGEIKTGFYKNRGQNNSNKRYEDQLVGKSAEICFYNIFKGKLKNLTCPDFKIYSAGRKSLAFDMTSDNMNIHIKTQSTKSAKRYSQSWI